MTPHELMDDVVERFAPAAVFALFSGGHDSLTSTHLVARHPRFTAAVHINTGIGVPATRDFVVDSCRDQGWPLIELHSEHPYERLVLERGGFPWGPKSHASMYWYLKQRPLDGLVRTTRRHRGDVVALVSGIRRGESVRRMLAAMSEPVQLRRGCAWVNPILDWSALDVGRYLEASGISRNPVVDLLHRSGECLCGALARADEIHELDRWYPEVGARIHALEAEARACGLRQTRWASGKAWGDAFQLTLPMCASCEANP